MPRYVKLHHDEDVNWILQEARRLFGEMYGTFVLTFIHAFGPIAESITGKEVSATASGLTAGFILVALIYSEGQVSGAHFNPAVSFAFALRGVFSWIRLPFYILAQIAAAAMLYALFGDVRHLGSTTPQHISDITAFGVEILFSLIMMHTILNVHERGHIIGVHAAIPVGLVQCALNLIGSPLTGASMNPARSLGPAVLSGGEAIETYWIYIAAPFLGAVIAVIITYILHYSPHPDAEDIATGYGATTQYHQ